MRMTGKITSWNKALRFGYARVNARDGNPFFDVYVNYQDVPLRPELGIARLREGEVIEFDIEHGQHGRPTRAKNIRIIPQPKGNGQ